MKSHKKLLSLILSLSTLICCFANLSVMASDIDVSSYTYVVDNMAFYKGDRQLSSPEGATEVAVDVTERIPTEESNTVIISAYSADGTFLGMNHSSQNFAFAKTQNIKLSLDIPTGKTVSEIRAFVWKSFSDMAPLSNALSSENNMIIDPELDCGENIVHTLDVKDLDDWDYELSGPAPYLNFFDDDTTTSTKYMLDPAGVSVYVNGVKVTTGNPILPFVIYADVGEVKLVDTYKTDGLIDAIYANKYVSGMFDGITSAGKIAFKSPDAGLSYITLDDEDESLEYNIYYNGEAITVDDLKKDDILTIAYDVTAPSVRDSKFYDIYVSRDVVTDTLMGMNNETREAKIGDTYYPFATDAKYAAFSSAKLGDIYTVYLDAFGKIFKAELSYLNYNFAIVEKFTLATADDDYKLTMFTADGESIAYYFDANSANVTVYDAVLGRDKVINKTTEGSVDALNAAVRALVYTGAGTTRKNLEDRVIQYKVKASSGKINELKFMPVYDNTIDTVAGTTKEEYSERKNAIGTIKLGDVTKIIDATKYASEHELSTATYASLTDEVSYKAYAYGPKIDGVFPFVLITEGESAYNKRTRFAVITEDGYYKREIDEETGDLVYFISAMCGDTESLVVSEDVSTTTLDNLKKGEVIFFMTNSKGQVCRIDKLTSWTSSVPAQDALAAGSLVNNNTIYANLTALAISDFWSYNFSLDFTHDWDSTSRDAIKVVYGPVMERTDYDIAFGKIDNNGKTNTDTDVSIFDFSDDIRVYTYDYAKNERYRFEYQGNATSAISSTALLETNMEFDRITVDWNRDADLDGVKENQETVTFAFAIVVNDEVQDILAFLPK